MANVITGELELLRDLDAIDLINTSIESECRFPKVKTFAASWAFIEYVLMFT